jgi:hypothetical protein
LRHVGSENRVAGVQSEAVVKNFLTSVFVFLACFAISAGSLPARGKTQEASSSKKTASAQKAAVHRTSARRRRHHYRHYSRRYHGPVKPSAERISEIQSALARGGYYHGDPNGKWDSGSVDAMRKFQEDHGLDGTGKLDALSLQKLGLGSEIAGVDAPHAPTPAQHATPPAQATRAPAGSSPDKPKPQTPKSPDSGSSVSTTPANSSSAPSSTSVPKPAGASSTQ